MKKKKLRAVVAGTLAIAMCVVEASAATKEVLVFGARFINDYGSDVRVTLEQLKTDFSPFKDNNSLTEYFHRDQPEQNKQDVDEAQAWLIDNGIISRDRYITVQGISSDTIPTVRVEKYADGENLYGAVGRSDALMYLYKGTFGPLYGRTIGVEVPNIRTEDGIDMTLRQLFKRHSSQSYDPDNIGKVTDNQSYTWNYAPQGDEWDSVFGDTNIFISDVDMEVSQDGNQGGDSVYGNGGNVNNSFEYETDYKQIYYKPGADVLFYRTTDSVEPYILGALNKGVLNRDTSARSAKFDSTFGKLKSNTTAYAAWSGNAYPYIVNRSITGMYRDNNAEYGSINNILGSNFNVSYTGNSLNITRNNLMSGVSGYFTSESVTKMNIYQLIYDFVYASEKKLSELETDIVNYKYSMQLNGVANEEDQQVIKYLVAKGILNFDGVADFKGLQSSMDWEQFIPILYRVANKDARLDFSKVQLTDSDQQWKAKGYYPQDVYVIPSGAVGSFKLELDPALDGHGLDINDEAVPSAAAPQQEESYKTSLYAAPLAENEMYATELYAETPIGQATYTGANAGYVTYGPFNMDFAGAIYQNNSLSPYYLVSELESKLQELSAAGPDVYRASYETAYDAENPKHFILHNMLRNVFVIGLLRDDPKLVSDCQVIIKTERDKLPVDDNRALKVSVFNGLLSYLNKGYNQTGDIGYININWDGKTIQSTNSVPYGKSSIDFLSNFVSKLTSVSFVSRTGKVEAISISYGRFNVISNSTLEKGIQSANATSFTLARDVTATELANKSAAELLSELQQSVGSSLVDLSTATTTSPLATYVDKTGKEAFVGWDSIEKYNANCTDETKKIPIEKISDYLLHNTATDTYGYFSNEKQKIALIGTTVVTGDSDLGVAFRSGEGEASTYYYHINAIRLLMNADQERSVISGTHGISMNDVVGKSLKSIPLYSNSGATSNSIVGFRALMSADDSKTSAGIATDSFYFDVPATNNHRFGDYIGLSQANRVMNVISRRMQWTSTEDKSLATGYAVVKFVPVPVSTLGAQAITAGTSMQDLMDSPVKPPSDPVGRKLWSDNKAACNAYANWVYGTSGQTYIETGYVRPEATLYILDYESVGAPPTGAYKGLSPNNPVEIVSLGRYFTGLASEPRTAVYPNDSTWVNKHRTTYFMAKDYSVLVSGDRVYLNAGSFAGLEYDTQAKGYVMRNVATSTATLGAGAFNVGSEFTLAMGQGDHSRHSANAMVLQTKSDGTIICEVGPFRGLPIRRDGTSSMVADMEGLPDTFLYTVKDLATRVPTNKTYTFKQELALRYPGVKYLGITEEPQITLGRIAADRVVFNGKTLQVFKEKGVGSIGEVALPVLSANAALETAKAKASAALKGLGMQSYATTADTYITISFPGYNYGVRDGKLVANEATAADYLSPFCFSNLNDMIINSMMNESNGAIPVNKIEEGALLKVGDAYYAATGTSEGKSFVGYAYLNSINSVSTIPTVQDAAKSFAGCYILGGNQYMNVVHFFHEMKLLSSTTKSQLESLRLVASSSLSLDNSVRFSLSATGKLESIHNPPAGTSSGMSYYYTPVKIVFSKGLMAYRSSGEKDGVVRYTLCNTAENSVSGMFSNLPFFSDSIFDGKLMERTTGVTAVNFSAYENTGEFFAKFRSDFEKARSGDMFTLFRLLLTLALCWLAVGSWLCYAFKFGNLMPLLESLRHPGGNQRAPGLDLFKIVSLGTISMDDELKLGKFIQYQLILAVLFTIVMVMERIKL